MVRGVLINLLILGVVLFTGCSSTSSGGDGEGDGTGEDSTISDEELALANQARWDEGSIPKAQKDGLFRDIQFSYDSAAIESQYHEVLKKNAEFLLSDPTLHAEVEGHCDKRGTNEYNLALGEERARAVAKWLVNNGVPASQLSTISYGEEIPIDPAENDAAFAKNRRAHFALYRKK